MYKFYLYLLLLYSYGLSQTINYEDVISQTLENNNNLKLQELNIEASKLDIQKVNGFSYGKLELSHEVMRTNHPGYIFNSKLSSREASFNDFGALDFTGPSAINVIPDNLNNPEPRNNFSTKITYDIPLFTGFKLSNQEELLKIKNKAELLKLTLDKRALEFEVLKAYNAAVVAKEFIEATKQAKNAVSQFVKSANEFYNEGLVTKIDTKQAKVQELKVQSKVTQAQNKFDIAIAYLRFLSSNEKLSNVKSLKLFRLNNNQELKSLYKEAIENRVDLKMLDISKDAMEKNVDLNKSSFYPNLYSHLEYGLNDDTLNFSSSKDYYMGLLGVKYTIFDTSRDVDLQKSKIELNKTKLNLNQLQNAIKLELEKAFLNLKAKEKIHLEKVEAKELSFEVLEQSKLMYKNQLISMTELLKQEASYRENEAELIMANYEKSIAQARLKLALGKSLRD
jgi:outer membrane protein TolC